MKFMTICAFTAAVTAALAAPPATPLEKYRIDAPSLWDGPALPLPDKNKDIMTFGSCPIWFMGTVCNDHGHDNSQPFQQNCPDWQKNESNGLQMIDEVHRLFPDTQFVLAGVFVPPLQFPQFLKKVYAKGAFYQSQKAPVLDADALALAGPHPLGDHGKELHTENWVMMTTPNYRKFFEEKLKSTAKLGVNNFKQVDFVWPWDQRYGYDGITVNLFRDYLNGRDGGLDVVTADGSVKNIKFWDYFSDYRGLRFTPADLNLKSFDEFYPVKEFEIYNRDASVYERRNLVVFFLLYHYAHLHQYQQMGRWAKEVGAVHDASANPESLYNACDNFYISKLNDFGTVYYEYFGSPRNAEAAYLFMNSYLLNARNAGKHLGLIKELGQGGHGRPHNTPVMEYVHNFDLVSNGFDYYHNEWEEGTFKQMTDPAEKYFNNRWRVWLGGAYGYKQSRDLGVSRPQPKMVQIADRSGGFYTESWVWDPEVRNTFGGDLLAAYADAGSLSPAQLSELPQYDTVFYTPLYTPRNRTGMLRRYLATGNRRIVTHSFIPYSLDQGVNYFAWDELPHQIAHHALDNLGKNNQFLLSPVFQNLQFVPGDVSGEVCFAKDNLGKVTVPEYWSWTPVNGNVLATIGGKPLITSVKDDKNNEFVYVHARLSRLDPAVRRRLVAKLVQTLDLPVLAKPTDKGGMALHRYQMKNGGDAVVMYDRQTLERTGAVLGYRPQEDWRKTLYQYRADGVDSSVKLTMSAPGDYLIYYPLSNVLDKQTAGNDRTVELWLKNEFAAIALVNLDTPGWRQFVAGEQKRHREIFENIGFDAGGKMLPTDYLFENTKPSTYQYQN